MAGDFNCVQCPLLDRYGSYRSHRSESPALDAAVATLGLADARDLRDHADDEGTGDPTDHFTYWNGDRASRIDRFYVPEGWVGRVLWIEARVPSNQSDHQEVVLHLRDLNKPRSSCRHGRVTYPIHSSNPGRIVDELVAEMDGRAIGQSVSTLTWDADVTECQQCVRRIRKRVKQRRARFRRKIQGRARRPLLTRPQFISCNMEELRQEHLVRLGQKLARTADQLRYFYKRVADWERNQTVTTISRIHGPHFTRDMTNADKFASEWSTVLGKVHCQEERVDLPSAIRRFVNLPTDRVLSSADNRALLADFSEAEVLAAVSGLSRHKSAGLDGLNNDFYKDTSALLVPALVQLSNQILAGADPPPSFLEALIIPLRKRETRRMRWITDRFLYSKPATRSLRKCWQHDCNAYYQKSLVTRSKASYTDARCLN
uniref:Endonuclease/exonuclease/phosphatase domain-containing protein n=1 Tax=Peronospora matthiolae TaxID=2874970 RepID=A0AAV1UCF0_9STRA